MRHRANIFTTIFLGLFLASNVWAAAQNDGVSVRASADKKAVFIGERVRYTIDVTSRSELQVELPRFKDAKIGEYEIKDSGRRDAKGFFGGRTYSRWYILAGYSVGKHPIPALEVRYKFKAKPDWNTKTTAEVALTVVSVLPKATKISDIRDIKGPLHFYEAPWVWIGSVLALIVLLALAFAIWKKVRAMMSIRPAHEIALKELQAIRDYLSKSGDVKEFYFKVSACVRAYVEARFDLRAPEMTTEEFLPSLRDSGTLSDGQKKLLKDFLEACDLVKFARYTPKVEEVESVFVTAKNFINETKLIPRT